MYLSTHRLYYDMVLTKEDVELVRGLFEDLRGEFQTDLNKVFGALS